MIDADFVLRRAGQLATMVPADGDPLGRIIDGALAARGGRVVWVGTDAELERHVRLEGDALDAAGACVIPGLVDAHTHPVFAGSRATEFFERQAGSAYQAQQSGERGIIGTVKATRAADPSTLLQLAEERADRFLATGTTTIEAKSGYGLEPTAEATSLDILTKLRGRRPLRIISTFLGAHVVPAGIDRVDYLRSLTEEMLPAFATQARFCDAWCDPPAFTPGETRTILRRARELGYGLRLHAAQLAAGEGPDIAAELHAASADHLEYATASQCRAMAAAGTIAVLCPAANLTTHAPRPPIDAMREAAVRIAIASDLNPGTSNSESLPTAMSLACIAWGMTPTEVLCGATVEAAASLGLEGIAGCLRLGSYADLALLDVETPEAISYYVGVNRVMRTVVGGVVWQPL